MALIQMMVLFCYPTKIYTHVSHVPEMYFKLQEASTVEVGVSNFQQKYVSSVSAQATNVHDTEKARTSFFRAIPPKGCSLYRSHECVSECHRRKQ